MLLFKEEKYYNNKTKYIFLVKLTNGFDKKNK